MDKLKITQKEFEELYEITPEITDNEDTSTAEKDTTPDIPQSEIDADDNIEQQMFPEVTE